MFDTTHRLKSPIRNDTGGAAGIVIAMVLVLALVAGAGFWVYQTHYKQGPLRTTLSALKTKAELIRFTHDRVSRALYHNLIMLDDIVVMMDKELKRLKRIGRKFPKQNGIVSAQAKELREARERLGAILKQVTARIEKIYVTWLVDKAAGIGQINSQKGTLARQLADAIRGEAVLISRIRNNPGNTS